MRDSNSDTDRPRQQVICLLIFAAALITSLWFTHAGWNRKLLDTHPFRQTQTAISAYWMAKEGITLNYPTPVMGAPWSIPMEFPLYQACVVKLTRAAGMSLESAGRAVSLFFFYAALPAVWLLLRRLGITAGQRWLFLALVLVSPVYVFYSRAFLIESTAFCLGVWFLYCFHAALEPRRTLPLVAAAGFGIAAGLAKVTTYAVFLVPAFAFGLHTLLQHRTQWRGSLIRGLAGAVPGIVAATWWVVHTDAVKRHNVFGVSMTSTEQRDWNYGPFLQRFEPDFWRQAGAQLERSLLPLGALIVFAVLAPLVLRGTWRRFAAILAVALAGPVVFANLYYIHDYYWYGSGLFFLAGFALPFKRLLEQTQWSLGVRMLIVVLALATQFTGYFKVYRPLQMSAATEPPEFALAIRQVVSAEDALVGFGMHWSSLLPYYSERRALMVPDKYSRNDEAITQALANLGNTRVGGVVVFRLGQPGPEFYNPWLKKLGMDENPFLQTGEYTLHIRKDHLPDALKALANYPLKQVLLYQGLIAKPGEKPPVIYYTDQVADKSMFSMMSPTPLKTLVPFGLGNDTVNGHKTFTAHTPTEIEIVAPPGAKRIEARFGIHPGAYDGTDGVEFEVVVAAPSGARQTLYRRLLMPGALVGDRGEQSLVLETTSGITGSVLFRTLPGGSPNFDWAYWSKIEVR